MTEPVVDAATARTLARSLRDVLQAAERVLGQDGDTPLLRMITEHIGCPINQIPNVAERWDGWEHANLQLGVDAYLAERSPGATWFGISGGVPRMHTDLMDMLAMTGAGRFDLAAVDYTTVAVGPDRSMEAVQFGLVRTTAPDGTPVVLAVRGPAEHGPPICLLQVLAAERDTASAVRERVVRLMRRHDVFRGQILTFGFSEYRANYSAVFDGLVAFQPRPTLGADQVVLPDGVLQTIERHVVLAGSRATALRAAGQHLKRGLLLHGPPGTGKTHTVRYLLSRLAGSTVIIMSGPALRFIGPATALARRLEPSVLVVEDVDLIAQDRSYSPDGHPLLFQLLNEIDGVGADTDTTFLLTTNRVEILEHALTDRPGRVDLAVEIPRPDADGRERLLRLYTRDVPLDVPDPGPLIEATAGVTASFIREWARRAVLLSLDRGGEVRLDEPTLRAALDELLDERSALTRTILGGPQPDAPVGPLPYPPSHPTGFATPPGPGFTIRPGG
ncbi:MAG TPA: ATP-binding protein [Actinophytocola sp.]|uniref:ATP-binding protein n=1 Tax=Actinophytocola sp. TaxID=1872138 RepID=UPI002DDD5578|nr:ATP-binding protein [Actinophytocola sp.]HEV2782232.1 ATP-binding protein [Actinophytocola sp.]